MSRIYELSRQLARRRADAGRVRAALLDYFARDEFTYSEVPPTESSTLDGFLFDDQAGLLPAVLRRDGAAAADGGHPRARRRPASPPARPTPRPASTSCATSTRTPGSRPTTPNWGWITFDPTPGRLARAQPARGRAPSSVGNVGSGGLGQLRRRPAVRARRRRPRRRRAGAVVADPGDRARGALAARRPRSPGAAPLAARRPAGAVASSSARCGARAASPRPARRCTRSSCASPTRPRRPAMCARCSESRYRDEPSHPTRAQRRGLRSELGRGGGILGRIRAWWALPPPR